MKTTVEFVNGKQFITNGVTSIAVPDDHEVMHRFDITQARIDNNVIFEFLVALHEIAAMEQPEAAEVAQKALAAYEARRSAPPVD